jgi:3-deoxy-D-manno-octulosonic-acid transferase
LKTKGIYFLYRTLQVFGLPVLLLYFLFRGFKNRAYWHSIPQRLGFLPRSYKQTGPGAIWLHAVSVGEVLACVELLRKLRAELPYTALFVSTSTIAGRATADSRLAGLADGVLYAPVDYVFAVRRVLRALRPSVVVVAETELWPNMIRETKRTGAGIAIVNGRISDRALPRYRRFRWIFSGVLPGFDCILAQTQEMRGRFVELGASSECAYAAGNLKFDFEAHPAPAESPVSRFIERMKPESVWIAASTTAPSEPGDTDEDDAVIAAFQQLARRRRLLLILAPRKPERFDVAASKLQAAGVSFTRRSSIGEARAEAPHALLLDTIGELSGLFERADAVFMGGTLARRGGHNVLEPALFGKPVVVGPHMENFQAIDAALRERNAVVPIAQPSELAAAVESLLASPELARGIGLRALGYAEAQRGAGKRAVAEIRKLHAAGVPVYRPSLPWYAFARVLAQLWKWGAQRGYRRKSAGARRLGAPVISVGNLTMGGTGKTPCVLRVAEILRERGLAPGILTRGYGRSSTSKILALAPCAEVSSEHTGDEPQIFIRSGVAPVGIGGNRYEAGRLLLQKFEIGALLLDDGFQHVQLARNLDIVLIDAMEPFGRGGVFPLGRLREPVSGIARAGVVILTRSDFSGLESAITTEVRRWNSSAPIFRAGVDPRAWVEYQTGRHFPVGEPPFGRIGAFCGLGNPKAFRRTLNSLGIEPLDWVEYEDHHRYRPSELTRIAHQSKALGADALVTTEKDSFNLCEGSSEMIAPLQMYWLKVGIRIEREDEFIQAVVSALD